MATLAGAKFDVLEADLLRYATGAAVTTVLTGVTTLTAPTVVLFTTMPAEDGTGGVEVVGGVGYTACNTRSPNVWTAPSTDGAGLTTVTNGTAAMAFGTASGAGWGTVVGWGLKTAAGGTLIYGGVLNASKTVNAGDTASFAINALTISET